MSSGYVYMLLMCFLKERYVCGKFGIDFPYFPYCSDGIDISDYNYLNKQQVFLVKHNNIVV